jgi:CheY-like chemotaxis protein
MVTNASDERGAILMNQHRVLIADDDVIIRSVLRSLLTKIGQTVEQAATSDDAVRLALATHYDLLILDIDMPTGGGLQVCRRLRREPGYADVPIVMLTALDNAGVRTLATDTGATVFIAKPFNPAQLMRCLVPHLDIAAADCAGLNEILASDRDLRLQDALRARSAAAWSATERHDASRQEIV